MDKLELKAVHDGSASYASLERKAALYDKLARGAFFRPVRASELLRSLIEIGSAAGSRLKGAIGETTGIPMVTSRRIRSGVRGRKVGLGRNRIEMNLRGQMRLMIGAPRRNRCWEIPLR
ncbi:hypothetical protein C1H46_024567 [Malus baccata]|uniref:Uncharacterized protein n=1 Tax=Malus baccata TaxID=106549 RepID=A0A540LTP0_MALBA|nr:hypothetical protein C1H46_024567 [Malus baccata]